MSSEPTTTEPTTEIRAELYPPERDNSAHNLDTSSALVGTAARAPRWLRAHAPLVTGVLAAVLVPAVLSEAQLGGLATTLAFALALLSLNLLLGYAGQISLGQAAFVGTGAFVAINLGGRGLPMLVTIPAAGLAVAVLTTLVGLPSLRIRGLAVAIATLVYGIAAEQYLFQASWFTGADAGLSLGAVVGHAAAYRMYLVALGVVVAVLLADRQLLASKLGRAFVTVRDGESRAVAFGVEPGAAKLRAYALSGLIAGMSGALYAYITGIVAGSDFDVLTSLTLLAFAVVGGAGSRAGVLASAALLVGLPTLVPPPDARLAPLAGGVILVLVILFLPRGLAGVIESLRGRRLKLAVTAGALVTAVAAIAANQARGAELADGWTSLWLLGALVALVLLTATVWLFGPADADETDTEGAIAAGDDSAERAAQAAAGAEVVRRVPRALSLRMPSEVLFAARDVSVRFGGVKALTDLSLEVREGEIVGLIGANGAGKSTFYNVVSGFVPPEPGSSLRYRGRELLEMRPATRTSVGIARTFQHMGLLRPETVEDNVLLAQHWLARYPDFAGVLRVGGAGHTEAVLRDRAEKALTIFGLDHLRGARLGALSYGTMRMVELAAAVASGADLLFFDEASAGLGPDEAHALGDRFHALRDELGLTLVVIEHHVPLIARTCDYVYTLASGRLLAEGRPAEIQSNPEVVAEFLGRSTIEDRGAGAGSDEDTAEIEVTA